MIEAEDHPEMAAAHQELLRRLGVVVGGGRRLDRVVLARMYEVVKTHRLQCRLRGINFPALVALVVPRLGVVEWKRADLELPSIRITLVNFLRDHPRASPEEVVTAFRVAWPRLKEDDLRNLSAPILSSQGQPLK